MASIDAAVMGEARLAGRPVVCRGCAAGPVVDMPCVEFLFPVVVQALVGDGATFVADDLDDLSLCAVCVRTAALRLGLHRDPRDDEEVRRLEAARDASAGRVRDALRVQEEMRDRIRELEMELPR